MITKQEHQKRIQKFIDVYNAFEEFKKSHVVSEEKNNHGPIVTFTIPSDPIEAEKYIKLSNEVKKAQEEINS